MSRASSVAAAAAALAAACRGGEPPSTAHQIARALTAALAAADRARVPWRCAAEDTPALGDEDLAPGWHVSGHKLEHTGAGSGADVVIGVVADAGGAAPATLAALGRLRTQLDDAHADVVVTLGGMGTNEREIAATLGILSDHAQFPVVALPGDLEPAGAHARAVASLRRHGDAIVDARAARWIELRGGAVIATIPGAGAQVRLAAGAEGCGWGGADVTEIFAALSARPGVRVVASAEAPRAAVADASADEPSGELALVAPATHPVDVHVHGPTTVAPTAARSGGRDGKATALSPGSADATTRLPSSHHASAAVLALHGAAWTWRPLVDARAARGR